MASSRRITRSSSYSKPEPEPPKVFDPASDVSDLESDDTEVSSSTEHGTKMDDDDFLSESTAEEDLDEELEGEPDFYEDEPAVRANEEGDVEAMEEDDLEGEEDAFDDVTEQDGMEDLDDLDDLTEEEEEEADETSDFELGARSKARRPTSQRTRQKGKGKQAQSKQRSSTRPTSRKQLLTSVPESSASTPAYDTRVMTKRQRAKLNESHGEDLLQLPMEPTKKKHLTEEEIALKKSEIARRRKHQSQQRAEQDKVDTINRLLRKQNTKRRSNKEADEENQENQRETGKRSARSQSPASAIRYLRSLDGCKLSIPVGVELPVPFARGPRYPPPVPHCSLPGCHAPKKYRSVVDSTRVACSMEHLYSIEGRLREAHLQPT